MNEKNAVRSYLRSAVLYDRTASWDTFSVRSNKNLKSTGNLAFVRHEVMVQVRDVYESVDKILGELEFKINGPFIFQNIVEIFTS